MPLHPTCILVARYFAAEIVETTFVISHFSDIRKEMTLFLVVPKKIDQEQRSFNVGSDNYNKQETTIIRPYFGDPKVVSTISGGRGSQPQKIFY